MHSWPGRWKIRGLSLCCSVLIRFGSGSPVVVLQLCAGPWSGEVLCWFTFMSLWQQLDEGRWKQTSLVWFILYITVLHTHKDTFKHITSVAPEHILLPDQRGEEGQDTYPPITVLLAQHHQHLSLTEAQLIVVVSLAVIQRLHPPTLCATRLMNTGK